MKTSGDILREAREEAELSQGELATKMGYTSPQIVSNWERGHAGIPTKNALLFCKLTGMKTTVMKTLLEQEAVKKVSKRLSISLGLTKKKKPATTKQAA